MKHIISLLLSAGVLASVTACGTTLKTKAGIRCIGETMYSLRDPSSFRAIHQEKTVSTDGKRIRVALTYSGTNVFGGRVQTETVCNYSASELTNA